MSSLQICRSVGPADNLALGTLALIADPGVVQWRVALHPNDLPLAHWRPVTEPGMAIPWISTGTQHVYTARAYAEVDNGTTTEIIVAVETQRLIGTPALATSSALNTPTGYIMRVLNDREPVYPLHHYNDGGDDYPQGNNFVPWLYHPGGYAWITDKTWSRDIGETLPAGAHDVIVGRFTPKQFNPSVDRIDLSASGVSIHAWVGSDNLDLHEGYLCFAVVCSFSDGKRGRYHLRRAFTIGTGSSFPESSWGLPSGSNADWQCTFGADGVPISSMPTGPDISRVEEIDIIARDYSAMPTGQIRIQEIAVKA